ncbi:MAG: rhodanese-like domain-containing protein [Acutalibacteraceae bacterium]
MINHIDFENAHRLISEKTDSVILDVREEEEYITGHAVGAALFPVDTIDEKTAAELIPNKNTPLFIYCRSGRRSKIAAEKLSQLGYTEIYDIGSLSGWPYGLE